MKLFFILIAFYTTSILGASFKEVNLAILDFEGAGVSQNETVMISDKFRSSMIEYSKYRIMERASMNAVLSEQGFQQSGACNSNSCLIEAGQLLGVTYMLAGRISHASGITAISTRIIDVSSGEIIFARSREYKSQFFEFISTEIPTFVNELVKALDISLNELAVKNKKGILYVESTPENGIVSIDGLETGRLTPTTFKDIEAGNHVVQVNSGLKVGTKAVIVTPGKLTRSTIPIDNGFGSVRIQSNVSGVNATIEGIGNYQIPVEVDSIPSGNYSIVVNNENYFPDSQDIQVLCFQITETIMDLKQKSFLRFTGITTDSWVYLDGDNIEPVNHKLHPLVPGKHNVKIKRQGYHELDFEIHTSHRDTTVQEIKYVPLPAELFVFSEPDGATILLNGKNHGTTPATLKELIPGNYGLQIVHKLYVPMSKELILGPGTSTTITKTFNQYSNEYLVWNENKQKASFLNFAFSGCGQLAIERDALGCTFLFAGIISDALLGISCYKLYSHTNSYTGARSTKEMLYFEKRKQEDATWLVSTALSSVAFRGMSFLLTHVKEYK
jgi:TolB-like protein